MPPKRKSAAKRSPATVSEAIKKRKEAEDQRKQVFSARLENLFHKNFVKEKPRSCGRSHRCVSKRHIQTIFTAVWCKDTAITLPAGRMRLSVDQIEYAVYLGWDAAYKRSCDGCLDYGKALTKARADRRKESGQQICLDCNDRDPEAFRTPACNKCIACMKKQKIRDERKKRDKVLAAPLETKYCRHCNKYVPITVMVGRFRNVWSGEVISSPTEVCGPCRDKTYTPKKGKEIRVEMRKEKLEKFESMTNKLKCKGCTKNCPLNLVKLKGDISRMVLDQDEEERIFASILEWDHRIPGTKTRNVSEISSKAKRIREQVKCDLLCVFCHRLKTYVNADSIWFRFGGNVPERVTRYRLRKMLTLRKEALQEQAPKGVCPGPMEGSECPFKDDFATFKDAINPRKYNTDLTAEEIVLMIYDFDHQNILEKLNVVTQLQSEAKKCIVKCCICHRWKTLVMRDCISWVALRHDSDEECLGDYNSFAGERDDGEWRMASF